MATIQENIAAGQALVEALGLRCITSPNDMNPPCVLIGAPRFYMQNAVGAGYRQEIPIEIIARGLTWRDLDWLYAAAPAVADAVGAVSGTPTVYRMSDGRELPAYTIIMEGN